MESHPSPVSILFFASILILARLFLVSKERSSKSIPQWKYLPILEPNLDRTLCHVDVRSNAFSGGRSRCWILVEFDFQKDELILSSSLALVVLLLLSKGAFARDPARPGRLTRGGTRGRG